MKSPLQLERHFFSKISIEVHPDGQPNIANELTVHVDIAMAVDNPKRYQVGIRVVLGPSKEGKACYTGEIHAIGLFAVADGCPEGKISLLVENGGASLLYGAVRELVLNLTARGPWPAVTLPSMVFGAKKTAAFEAAPPGKKRKAAV